jgi:hypothetical protein
MQSLEISNTKVNLEHGDGSFQNFIMKINEHLATKIESEKPPKFPITYTHTRHNSQLEPKMSPST